MARTQQELAPVQTIFPEIEAGSRFAIVPVENMEQVAKDSVTVSAAITSLPLGAGRIPGFLEVTDPIIDAEPLRPSQNPTLGGNDLKLHVNHSGRSIDIVTSTSQARLGGGGVGSNHNLAVFDEAFMPGLAGMEGDIARAERVGDFSTYWPLCRKIDLVNKGGSDTLSENVRIDTDVFYVCTQTKDGDWAVRSIIAGDEAHTQDGMLLRSMPNSQTDTLDSEPEEFIDYLATKLALGELSSVQEARDQSRQETMFAKEFMRVGDADNSKSQAMLAAYIGAVAQILLEPGYDYMKDRGIPDLAKKFIARVLPSILENDSRLGSPAHPFLRAASELRNLRYLEESGNLSKQGKKGLDRQRARLMQSMVSAQGYQAILGRAEKLSEHTALQIAQLNAQGFTMPNLSGPMLRFEVVSYDTTDSLIGAQALRALTNMSRNNPRGHNPTVTALDGILEQLKPRAEKTQRRMVIKANGTNKLRPYSGFTSRSTAGAETDMISYDGAGISHKVFGHYPHEIAMSLRKPYEYDPRFGNSGIAMPGIAAMFESTTEAGDVRCMILSAKQMPWCLTRALHERTHNAGRKVSDIRDALSGDFKIIQELEKSRIQRWRIGELVSDGIDLLPEVLTNGSAFAFVADREGKIKSDFGTIRGEHPRGRNYSSLRKTTRHDIPLPVYHGGAEPYTDGLVRRDNGHAIFELRCADGGLFVTGGKSFGTFAVNAQVTRPFVKIERIPKRR